MHLLSGKPYTIIGEETIAGSLHYQHEQFSILLGSTPGVLKLSFYDGMKRRMIDLLTPIVEHTVASLHVGDTITISGNIICGRDAVLPKLIQLLESGNNLTDVDIRGQVIFHTAVSPAGVGPTSSNKLEIESSIAPLSKLGIKLHLGKGELHLDTIKALERYNSVYAIIPPVTALLGAKTSEERVIAFPELGMEALHLIKVNRFPAIIAAAHGKSIYAREGNA